MADNRIYESASNIEKGEANSPASTDGGWRFSKHATETTATPSLEPTTLVTSRVWSWGLEDFPVGYPKVAAFQDSDENFMIYRRFGFLFSRVLLYKQDELRELEENLNDMDERDAEDPDDRVKKCLKSRDLDDSRTIPSGWETRRQLLQKIEKKLDEYSRVLLQAQQLVAMNQPAKRDQTSVWNFLKNERPQLLDEDAEYISRKEDLVTLRPGRETAWLDASVERMLKETRQKTSDDSIRYFSKGRINIFVTLLITLIILVLLVVPVYALWHLSSSLDGNSQASSTTSVGVLLVSTLLFSAVLSAFTKAKRHEILGASAG
ncbi:hypothetical protein MMC20_003562 [Loxospora ochrophaea]|nr:hypothetical protein [Loxospora ochrophaea]